MARKDPSIMARWTKKGPVVKINHFEYLSPVKIDKLFEAAIEEWVRLRAVSIGQRRKQDLEERAGAENG